LEEITETSGLDPPQVLRNDSFDNLRRILSAPSTQSIYHP
jgi:hypothetical protein